MINFKGYKKDDKLSFVIALLFISGYFDST